MATTSSNLVTSKVAGKALAMGQGGNGRHNKGRAAGLVATAALGLSLLVGGLLSQGQQATPTTQPNAMPLASDTYVATRWDFREDRRVGAAAAFAPDQFTYREDRRADAAPAASLDTFVADQFTYREDRRVGASIEFAPDPFTYREDRRVGLEHPMPTLTPPGPAHFQGEDY